MCHYVNVIFLSSGPSKQLSSSPQSSTRITNMDTPSPLPIGLDEPEWILGTDSHINVAVREEFAFEQVSELNFFYC